MSGDAAAVTLVTGVAAPYPAGPFYHPAEEYPELAPLGSHDTSSANGAYRGVRRCLLEMGLDAGHAGTADWNPLRNLVSEGGRVVIKPNMVRHFNELPDDGLFSVVTHWSVVRPLIDYALLAVGRSGEVVILDAPQHDCDMDELKRQCGVDPLIDWYSGRGFGVRFVDARRERVEVRESVLMRTVTLPGDPAGAVLVNLGLESEFNDLAEHADLLRGSDYDDRETAYHHTGGRNEYLISRTVLSADLVVNVPKAKTHAKIGMTAAMKNLVGMNADKNYLPHWRVGFVEDGGDQFARRTTASRLRLALFRAARPWLRRGGLSLYVAYGAARVVHALGLRENFGGGVWHGNDTIWRTTVDLNKIIRYAASDGSLSHTPVASRSYLTICDAVIAGEGNGPLAPRGRHVGWILGARDPVACDAVLARMFGFEWRRLKVLERAFRVSRLPLTDVKDPDELQVSMCSVDAAGSQRCRLGSMRPLAPLVPPSGWRGYVELRDAATTDLNGASHDA